MQVGFPRSRQRDDLARSRARARNLDAPSVSVVIPTLNEAENLPHVLAAMPHWVDDIIVIDGLSHDGTVAVASNWARRVQVVSVHERGKGRALRAGFEAATTDIVVAMDADGSNDPFELPRFVGALLSGADVALGTRFATGGGTSDMELHRRLGNHALRLCVRMAFGTRYSDLCYGYMAFWRDVLPALDGPHAGFEVETMVHIRARQHNMHVVEIPSFERERLSGTSHLHAVRDGLKILRTITRERRRARAGVPPPLTTPMTTRIEIQPPWYEPVDLDLTVAEPDPAL
ncbi:MAG TPA: glycosyltransferase family 2 protein [Acidimicrobiia bacterium]|nr:glycosyltransferase family 2 protein [Acidimicrobiia bacterium]